MSAQKYVIVPTSNKGVYAGYLESQEGQNVVLTHARHLWYWGEGVSLQQVALEGVEDPDVVLFQSPEARVELSLMGEMLECTEVAEANIKAVLERSS